MQGLVRIDGAKTPTFYFKEKLGFSSVSDAHIAYVKEVALESKESARICMHNTLESDLHNMIIAHHKGKYIRPHKNPMKSKAYQILEGEMRIIGINEQQNKLFDITLGLKNKQILRIEPNIYLLLLPLTQLAVFCEVALGPFSVAGGGGKFMHLLVQKKEQVQEK